MRLMSLLSVLGAGGRSARPNRAPAHSSRRRPRVRLHLEALEDRTVPSNLVVTKSIDDIAMPGTLRYAVAHAASGDTIVLKINQLGGPIVLTQGELLLDKDLTIRTSGSGLATVSGNNDHRVFEVAASAHVSLSGLLITRGAASFGAGFDLDGGGILNFGTLTVSGCTISDNSAFDDGGGIYFHGTVTLSGCTLSGNVSAELGGGIYVDAGTVTISNSTLTGNAAIKAGGGIYNNRGTVTVSNSTLSGDSAADGGGIVNNIGTVTVSNSSLSGNSASDAGGGIYNGLGTVTVSGSTLSSNIAPLGGGVYNGGQLTIEDKSTVSGNYASLGADLYWDLAGFPTSTVSIIDSTVTDVYIAT